MRSFTLIITLLAITVSTRSAVIHVPQDHPTIQEAIDAAQNGDTILVDPGTYIGLIDFMGKAVHVQSTQGPEVTTIDGNADGSVVAFMTAEGPDSILDGFTVTNGTGTTIPAVGRCGGGICCDQSSPTIRNNMIFDNHAATGDDRAFGGGIYCVGAAVISGNDIVANKVSAKVIRSGGGVFCDGCVEIRNNTFKWNHTGQSGDGIYCRGNAAIEGNLFFNMLFCMKSTATIENNAFRYLNRECGIECWYSSPKITNNTIIGVDGITLEWESHGAEISGNIIVGNRSQGIRMFTSSATIENNILCGNRVKSQYGGGISAYDSPALIKNNIIAGNRARRGGGVSCRRPSQVTIENNLIIDNEAEINGGGVWCGDWGAQAAISNSILWNNVAPEGKELTAEGILWPTITIGYSDVEGGTASAFVSGDGTLNWGDGMIDTDPLLVAGPHGMYYLSQVAAGQAADSPCVDTGSDLASNLGMDARWTRNDEIPDIGTVDMGFHFGTGISAYQWLRPDSFTISAFTGGAVNFVLDAGLCYANRNYVMVGGMSGAYPGLPLAGGLFRFWLNYDPFMEITIVNLNTPMFTGFLGTTDASGTAGATLDSLGPIPGTEGVTLYFAYALTYPWEFSSNPVAVMIVP